MANSKIRDALLSELQRTDPDDFYFTGHESGGVHGLTDRQNRAHAALLALQEIDRSAFKKWLVMQNEQIRSLYAHAQSQAQTPSWKGEFDEGISQNRVVTDAKIQTLFRRRFRNAEVGSQIDFSDNALMALRFTKAVEPLLWAYLLQLRAKRRSAMWTDREPSKERRDATTGKITGSAICTALEIRMLLAESQRWLKTRESEWLFYEVVKALPFVDVHDVFAARNLVSQLRDIVGRQDVSVKDIGKSDRLRVPLYAAIHQHYSADSALLVEAYVADRVLRGKNARDFLQAEDLRPYIADVKMVGFSPLQESKQISALEVVQRLYRSVKHSWNFSHNFAILFPFIKAHWPANIPPDKASFSDEESVELAKSLHAYWPALHAQKDGYHAMQILRALHGVTHRLIFESRKRPKRVRRAIAQALFVALRITETSAIPALSLRHASLTLKAQRAERKVIEEKVDVDLDPRFVDGLLKESPDLLLQPEHPKKDLRVYALSRVVEFVPGIKCDSKSALFVRHWNDPELYRENPALVFCEHDVLCAPLSHARFWAEENDVAILSGARTEIERLLSLRQHEGESLFVWQTQEGTLMSGHAKPAHGTLAQKIKTRVGVKNDPSPTGDWSFKNNVHHPAPRECGEKLLALDDLFIAARPYDAFSIAGAKAVLLSLLKREGFCVPPALVLPFYSSVHDLSLPKMPGNWIFRSAGHDEDLPGHSKAGANLSFKNLRARAQRERALIELMTLGSKKHPMSVLLQRQISPRFSGVSMSRSFDGIALQVAVQFTRGGGGGVLSTETEVQTQTLTRFQLAGARSKMLNRVYEQTLNIEALLNDVFYPSGSVMRPVEVEWGWFEGEVHVFQARFRKR